MWISIGNKISSDQYGNVYNAFIDKSREWYVYHQFCIIHLQINQLAYGAFGILSWLWSSASPKRVKMGLTREIQPQLAQLSLSTVLRTCKMSLIHYCTVLHLLLTLAWQVCLQTVGAIRMRRCVVLTWKLYLLTGLGMASYCSLFLLQVASVYMYSGSK